MVGSMPVAVHITARKMSHEDRQQVLRDYFGPEADDPEGRLYHATYGEDDDLRMFEVWDSEDRVHDHFGRMLAATYGITYEVHPLHGERRPD
jgi:hypothetical protein